MGRKKKMKLEEAVGLLRELKDLRTDMLEPLGIPFDHWLIYCQKPAEIQKQLINLLIKKFEHVQVEEKT